MGEPPPGIGISAFGEQRARVGDMLLDPQKARPIIKRESHAHAYLSTASSA